MPEIGVKIGLAVQSVANLLRLDVVVPNFEQPVGSPFNRSGRCRCWSEQRCRPVEVVDFYPDLPCYGVAFAHDDTHMAQIIMPPDEGGTPKVSSDL